MSAQRPLELILARNLLSSISTPAFLVGAQGALLFYNEAAATLVGLSFEEGGSHGPRHWTSVFGPFSHDDEPLNWDEIPATIALRANRPYHGHFRISAPGGGRQDIEASAIPIVGPEGSSGAIVIFWPATESEAPTS
jgi:PAS domain-containing protein